MKLSKFKQDVNKAADGTWVDVGDGLKLKVARQGNKNYNSVVRTLMKPYKQAIKSNTLADSVYEDLQNKAISQSVLLSWEGLEGEDGKDMPYSQETAYDLLSNPAFEDLKSLVVDLSNELETFREAEKEELSGK